MAICRSNGQCNPGSRIGTAPLANGEPNRTVQVSEASYEQEQLAFVANGQVTTADGREITF